MQIYQFPELQSLDDEDIYPVSHNDAVYGVEYSTLKADLAGATSAKLQGSLANNTDLDTVTTAGVYRLTGGNSYTNRPYTSTAYAMLEVVRYSATATNLIMQRLTQQGGVMFIRFYASSAWGSWVEIASNQMIQRGTASGTTVEFTTPFATTPTITLTPVTTLGTNPILAMVMNPSTTGFTIVKKYDAGSSGWLDASANINWIAIGRRF